MKLDTHKQHWHRAKANAFILILQQHGYFPLHPDGTTGKAVDGRAAQYVWQVIKQHDTHNTVKYFNTDGTVTTNIIDHFGRLLQKTTAMPSVKTRI